MVYQSKSISLSAGLLTLLIQMLLYPLSCWSSLPVDQLIDCGELDAFPDQRIGRAYQEISEKYLVNHCIVLVPGWPNKDISTKFNSLPENTLALFYDGQLSIDVMGATFANSADPCATLLTPASFCASKTIKIKRGQMLVGVSAAGKRVVVRGSPVVDGKPSFKGGHMLGLGSSHGFAKQQTSVIKDMAFYPALDNVSSSIDSIIYTGCFDGDLIVTGNHFKLDTRAALYSWCSRSTSDNGNAPHIEFSHNIVEGSLGETPQEGLLLSMSKVSGVPGVISINENVFIGPLETAIELRIGEGATSQIHSNEIAGARIRSGLLLHSPSRCRKASPPFYEVRGNIISVVDDNYLNDAVVFDGGMDVLFANNVVDGQRILVQKGGSLHDKRGRINFRTEHIDNISEHSAPCSDLVNFSGTVFFDDKRECAGRLDQ